MSVLKTAKRFVASALSTITIYDAVTGLPNRAGFERKIAELIDGEEGGPVEFGILVISMGRYRSVIDLAGIQGNDNLHWPIAERLAFLLQHGCDEAQGFYIARPMSAPAFEHLFSAGNICLPGEATPAANGLFRDLRSA